MEEIIKLGRTDTMTSLEIAEITGKLHKHIMEAIRKWRLLGRKSTGRDLGWLNILTRKARKDLAIS